MCRFLPAPSARRATEHTVVLVCSCVISIHALREEGDVILHEAQIADAQKEIKVLKDATLNNMVNNVFLINFNTVTSVAITSGIYDSVARKIYV